MAFPQATVIASGNTAANVTSFSATVHGGTVAAGDLLVLFVGVDGPADSSSIASGWTTLTNGAGRANAAADNGEGRIFLRVADGTEASTVTVDITSLEGAAWASWQIPAADWFGTLAGVEAAVLEGAASSVTPDPPDLSPSWGAEDTLWFVFTAWDGNTSFTSAPTNYPNDLGWNRWANTGGFGAAGATRELNAATENDAGTFTISASDQWVAFRMAVRPAAAAGNVTVTPGIFAIVVTMFAPTVTVSDHVTLTPGPFALAWTGFVPTVSIAVNTQLVPAPFAVAWTGLAPTIAVSDHVSLVPTPFGLAWTGFAPDVSTAVGPVSLTPDPFAVAWTGLAPTVIATDHVALVPNPWALAWTGLAPTVVASDNVSVTPDPWALLFTGFAPDVFNTGAAVVGGSAPVFAGALLARPAGAGRPQTPSGVGGISGPTGSGVTPRPS